LDIRGLSKDYGSIRVVNDIHISVSAGTIHALLGENGAGKSTLIKMVAGVIPPDAGHLEIDGQRQQPKNVADAQALGIVALPQELTLVPGLGAAENIYLGQRQPGSLGVINHRRLERNAREQMIRLGQSIPMNTPVGELSAVQQTMVALARALARNARVLVLDEPTAALTDTETEQLFDVLRGLRAAGTSIIYVSHRLEEVFRLADAATVMRNGSLVWTKPINETTTNDVVAAMIGRSQGEIFPPRSKDEGIEVLRVTDLTGYRLRGVSIAARSGRVLGIAGLAGAGRSELLKIIAGAQKAVDGEVRIDGKVIRGNSVKRAMVAGVALVPEERRSQGLIMKESIQGNIALANLPRVSRFGVASRRRERAMATRKVAELQIKAASVRQPVEELSGGNQQKVVLAKYLEQKPRVLLLDEPTRGIDIGTKAEIYTLVRGLASQGVAVIVVSSEIPELLGIADEIAVLHQGTLTGVVPAAETDEQSILHYCYGKSN
jgi:ribose transport system ATP-binding protein/rhamnose transport system ATP-binding protein